MRGFFIQTFTQAKRLVMIVVGFTVLAVGLVMVVTPGPAVLVIPIGLAILATEFVWARRLLDRMKKQVNRLRPNAPDTPAR